jgi:hypothetical protein
MRFCAPRRAILAILTEGSRLCTYPACADRRGRGTVDSWLFKLTRRRPRMTNQSANGYGKVPSVVLSADEPRL